ncbi:D-alanyl-D-alanine carboxypeptidase [Streptomyces sp. NPDC015414]|uniref:D-alanyl-D-alanine carboxypeptidase n=1 Tax=Streptomyces sp. NPDC015414 TaxID=3364957 RepID=UPI0036F54413
MDTATKILSMRDVKAADDSEPSEPRTPEGDQDSDLREAVSAWIRSAKNPETESGAGSDADEDTGKDRASATTSAEAKPGAGAKPGTDAKSDADADAKPGAGVKSGADAESGARSETKSGAESESETRGETEATAGSGAKSGETGTEAAGKTAKGADAGSKADAGSDRKPATDARAAKGDDGPKAGPDAAVEDADSDPEPGTGTGREADRKAATASDAKTDAGTGAKAAGGSRTGTTSANRDTGRGADRKADTASDAKTDAGTGAKAAGGSRTGGTSANPDAGSGVEAEADGGKGAVKAADASPAKAGADGGAKGPETAPKGADGGSGAKAPDAKAAKVAGAKAAAAAARAAKAAAEASGAKAAAETSDPKDAAETSGPKDAAEAGGPKDADGEGAPQGPPAADDESRTGGAGGKTSAAEGAAGAKGVDQPTTAFKAVRPKKPQVDQPTTMLKLGTAKPKPEGGTKPPAPEAERTSRFVPLRDSEAATPTSALPQVGPERTTQQPLPPKPPLDLLAELTNTPPPPETPVRTLVRRVKIWTPLVILLAIVFAVVQAMRPLPQPTLDLTAKDSYTFDGARTDIPWPAQGQAALDVQGIGTFGSSGTQKPVPIASVAKVMTAYIILRDHPLKSGADGPKIKIDQAAQDQSKAGQESTVDVTAGDSISQREALESILIASANNVARLLARWDVGSEKEFVAKMNSTAKGLGMADTTYTDPSGLTNSTVSTAVDQVKLAKAAMEEPAFREVAAMMSYDDYKGVNHSNWNHLVGHNNVVGIKTGTTTSALGNLVFAAKQEVGGETRTIVGAVVRQPAGGSDNTILSGALDAADKLIRSAQGALKSATVLKKGDVVGYVDDGLGGRTPVVATKDVAAAGWSGLKVKLSFASDVVPHTAKAGTKVGTLTVGDGGAGAVKVPVALRKDLAEPGLTDKLTRLG